MSEERKVMLLALADRCEAVTGPDRELDELIAAALEGAVREVQSSGRVAYYHHSGSPWMHVTVPDPGYTASLDAAMGLAPEGNNFSLDRISGECGAVVNHTAFTRTAFIANRCATPALALTAASLRALAAAPSIS